MLAIFTKVLAVALVFTVLTQQCYCESTADEDKRKSSAEVGVVQSAVPHSLTADSSNLEPAVVAAVPEAAAVESSARSVGVDVEEDESGIIVVASQSLEFKCIKKSIH